jgi:hypothetical protein
MTVLRAAVAAVVVLAVPAAAQAGTLTAELPASLTYTAATDESVTLGVAAPSASLDTDQTITYGAGTGACFQQTPARAECPVPGRFIVNLFGNGGNVDGSAVTALVSLEAHGGTGADRIAGTANADQLTGDAGDDTIGGGPGNDSIDAGPGNDEIDDGAGNDAVTGGTGDDTWVAGPGADAFTPGDGADRVSYEGRTAPVTITLDGVADDGETGEGDNAGTAESAIGGAGNDRIVGNDAGGYLYGRSGNDSITAGRGEDRVEGNEGDDTIDTRDGRFDSIDCGAGTDTLFADPGDSAANCEIAPDVDGDGVLPPADCAPNDPAVNPNAGEIVGNNVDENCDGVAAYLRVASTASFLYDRDKKRSRIRFTKFQITEVKAGDRIEIRCTSKRKGCPFTTKRVTGGSKRTVNALSHFKKRFLKRGAVIEVRVTRPNEIGSVRRLTVGKKGAIKTEPLCLPVGATKPSRCA